MEQATNHKPTQEEIVAQTRLNVLVEQRNTSQNQVVELAAENARLNAVNQELTAQVQEKDAEIAALKKKYEPEPNSVAD